MPYRSSYNSYRKPRYNRRPKRYMRRGPREASWAQVAQKALKTAKWVAGIVNAEYKYVERDTTAFALDFNGAIDANLAVIPQGSDVNEREGDSIKIKNMTFEGAFTVGSAGPEIVRMIVFIDKQNEINSVADYLEATGNAVAVFSNKNQNLKFNSNVLLDRKFTLSSQTPIHRFKNVIKINKHMHFVAGATTATNNYIKLLVIGQYAANGATITYHSHITYIDN